MKTTKQQGVSLVAAAWCGVLTLVRFDAYWVYQLSRWGVCAVALYAGTLLTSFWRWLLWALAVLFNPIAPIHLGRDAWQVVDGLAAIVFFVTVFLKK